MKPLIGLTSYFVEATELGQNRARGCCDQDMIIATSDYARSIELSGGIPMILPCTQEVESIKDYVSRVDGILFSGGEDIQPSYYGQAHKKGLGACVPLRDSFEWLLLKEALKQNKPILGICRGLQLINAYYGGTMFQDLNQLNFTTIEHSCLNLPKYSVCHEVEIYVDTHLYNMIQEGKIGVNTKHHQSIDTLGQGLIVSAKAMDGVIEGIEDPAREFLVAVQWHPEMMAEKDSVQLNIFSSFVRYCKK